MQYAGGRTRTGTKSPPRDFKSLASANSATPAEKRTAAFRKRLLSETTQKGLGPLTSAVTGRRSNQLSHWAIIDGAKHTLKTAYTILAKHEVLC